MPDRDDITGQNRRAWNEIAEVRGRRWAEKHPASLYREGGSTLSEFARAAAGDVAGKTLLHLQCATGEDSLSWAVAGANVTGVDISDRAIELARERAGELVLDVRFVASDVYHLPAVLAGFDVVYTGGGALVWLPDLEGWARAIERSLASGGILIVEDEHPLAMTLSAEGGEIVMKDDYFQRGRIEPGAAGWTHFDDKGRGTEPKYQFVWPLGDIVTALAEAGLHIQRLSEHPTREDQRWRYGDALEKARAFPGWFVLVARKP